jgi:hypothetical protein
MEKFMQLNGINPIIVEKNVAYISQNGQMAVN